MVFMLNDMAFDLSALDIVKCFTIVVGHAGLLVNLVNRRCYSVPIVKTLAKLKHHIS